MRQGLDSLNTTYRISYIRVYYESDPFLLFLNVSFYYTKDKNTKKSVEGYKNVKKELYIKLLIVCLFIITCFLTNEAYASNSIGEKASEFTVKTVEGKQIRLSDYKGKVMVLNFWTTWCTYCQEEMQELIDFTNEVKSLDINVVAINVTNTERSKKAVEQFINSTEIPFVIGLDEDGEITKDYRVIGIPTTFIIDKGGRMKRIFYGPITKEILMKEIK